MYDMVLGPLQLSILVVAGIIAGFINTLAGGGSLLTLPALIFLGLPSPIANGTNRVSVILQNTTSVWRFHRAGKLDVRTALIASLPAMVGAIIGALVAVELPEEVFDIALGVVIVLVVAQMLIPKRKPRRQPPVTGDGADGVGSGTEASATESTGDDVHRAPSSWVQAILFFFIGIYGGFIQAGIGFLLISTITMAFGTDLIRTNAIKVTIVGALTLVALAIFAVNGSVVWSAGLILAVSSSIGAWLGVRFAIKRGAKAIRWVVIIAAGASALRLFGII